MPCSSLVRTTASPHALQHRPQSETTPKSTSAADSVLRAVAFIRANRHLCGEYVPDRLEGCESLDVSFVSEYWSKTIRERGRPGAFVRRGDRRGLLTYLFALALTSKSNDDGWTTTRDRKSTRLNSSHVSISYAVFCLKINNK